ncbi:MAG: ABC transporter substrate-binding protein [Elusimicrobiales bacterium]
MKKTIIAAALAALLSGCSGERQEDEAVSQPRPSVITVELGRSHHPRFAGLYAAREKGWFRQEGLNVEFHAGEGPSPEQMVSSGQAQFGVDRLPEIIIARDGGQPLVNVAQIFQRSGAVIALRPGLKSLKELKGRRLALRYCDSEAEVFSALSGSGLSPGANVGILRIQEDEPFSSGRFDAVSSQTYDWVVRADTEPAVTAVKLHDTGLFLPQDALFTSESVLGSSGGRDAARRLVRAALRGYIFCRDNAAQCAEISSLYARDIPKDRAGKMIEEVNRLIWPASKGVGWTDARAFRKTASILYRRALVAKQAEGDGFTNKYVNEAQIYLRSQDVKGKPGR